MLYASPEAISLGIEFELDSVDRFYDGDGIICCILNKFLTGGEQHIQGCSGNKWECFVCNLHLLTVGMVQG